MFSWSDQKLVFNSIKCLNKVGVQADTLIFDRGSGITSSTLLELSYIL